MKDSKTCIMPVSTRVKIFPGGLHHLSLSHTNTCKCKYANSQGTRHLAAVTHNLQFQCFGFPTGSVSVAAAHFLSCVHTFSG